jgi:signal transduction histidine kinase
VTANDGIRSVVDNLLENAVEHNDAADPHVEVAVTVGAETVRLVVTDNGPGIPDQLKQSLFDPGEDGFGGGLSLVYTLVTGYGGEVSVADADPSGTRFVVELPRDEDRPTRP